MPAVDEDDRPKKKIVHEIGQDLTLLSATELTERIARGLAISDGVGTADSVVTADYDSYEKAALDNEGALVLAGVFKTDDMEVKYLLHFIQNNKIWKVSGIKVDATRKKQ